MCQISCKNPRLKTVLLNEILFSLSLFFCLMKSCFGFCKVDKKSSLLVMCLQVFFPISLKIIYLES